MTRTSDFFSSPVPGEASLRSAATAVIGKGCEAETSAAVSAAAGNLWRLARQVEDAYFHAPAEAGTGCAPALHRASEEARSAAQWLASQGR